MAAERKHDELKASWLRPVQLGPCRLFPALGAELDASASDDTDAFQLTHGSYQGHAELPHRAGVLQLVLEPIQAVALHCVRRCGDKALKRFRHVLPLLDLKTLLPVDQGVLAATE